MLKAYRGLMLLPIVVLALAACAVNPHKTAQTVEQQGDAVYGELVIAKEQGAKILQDATVSDVVKKPIAQLIVQSKPVTDNLQASIVLYDKVKADVASGASTEEKLAIVNRELAGWIAQAQPLITKLVAAVAGARK
jgi:phosphosulfolactate phosphohydrolase-like enzyme